MHTFGRSPVEFVEGHGMKLTGDDGREYLDFLAGIGVCSLGHGDPAVLSALEAQTKKLMHVSNYFYIEQRGQVAALLSKLANDDVDGARVLADAIVAVDETTAAALGAPAADEQVWETFFANSGAEADENAVKVARGYTKRPNIITFTGAFHGRTLLTMTMTAKKAYATDMGPLATGVYRAEFPYFYRSPGNMNEDETIAYCLQSIQNLFEEATPADQVAAIILEPLQGEGGFIPAPIPFVKALRKICDDHGILLIADEVQSGFCRTGKMFASEYWKEAGCAPDILATAKSIAGGMPISAIIARKEIMEGVPAGTVGGTFCGNPLSCAAALKTIEIMERDNLAARSQEIGQKVMDRCAQWQKEFPVLGNVRGMGAMLGLEFVKDPATKEPNGELVNALVQECARHGLMVENAGRWGQVIRFLAPLTITDEQLECGLDILENAIRTCTK